MQRTDAVPPELVRRAATVARGPHACPSCEGPTWAEPPIPWIDLRDYVVQCDGCQRPVAVRVDRERLLRPGGVPRHLRVDDGATVELLDTRGPRAFALRVLAAAALPVIAAATAWELGAEVPVAIGIAAAVAVPGSLWGPALVAKVVDAARRGARRIGAGVRTVLRRGPRRDVAVEVAPGRWDQWNREQKLRERDRAGHPDAVLRELERVLDPRELRRVRLLAERGEVPPDHLEDLLRFRCSWQAPGPPTGRLAESG